MSLIGQNQDTWEDMMGNPDISLFEIKEAFNEANPNIDNILPGNGHKPFKRWEYLMETRVDENGFYQPLDKQKIYEQLVKSSNQEKAANNPWSALGPSNEPNGNNGIGRINVIAVHPTGPDTIFVGTPAGGLWRSYDGGNTWTTNTDNFTSMGVSEIIFHPNDPTIMYMATGDRDHNDTSTSGIYKSTDSGINWTLTNFAPNTNGLPGFYLIHRILIDPTSPSTMLAATTSGVFRTTNDWSTWTETLANDCLRHMEFKTNDSNIIYGTTSGNYCGGLNSGALYFRSTNNGASWNQITLPDGSSNERIAIGVTAAAPNEVFLLAAYNDPNGSNDFNGLYRSTNSGASFTKLNPSHEPSLGSQQWYDWSFCVDPNDEDVMFAGGVHIERTTNGGSNWSRVSNNGPNDVHVDHHFAQYFGNTLFVGSDGGIWTTTNDGSSWNNHNDGLAITQYYRISNAETDSGIMLAGAQDNGTHQLDNGTWIYEFGGDGMDNAIDPDDEDNLYVSYQYGNFFRSTNGGGNFSNMISSSTTGTSGAWVTPIKIDENNTSILYTGYDKIWRSTNSGASWSAPNSTPLTGSNNKLQYIDVAKSDSDYIYTTNYSQIWRSTNGGTTWSNTSDPGSNIRWLEIDPNDETHVWACVGNNVFETTNSGGAWTNIGFNLPNISMNTLVYDDVTDVLHVGSDLGVWSLDDGSSTWTAFNNSLPNTVILELDILESSHILRAATFGRGVWEASLADLPCAIDDIFDGGIDICDAQNGTYDRIVMVEYTTPPASGTLDVNGISIPITSSPQGVLFSGLPLDGQAVDITASFSADPACTLTVTGVFINPTSGTYYEDSDGDGYGHPTSSIIDCEQPMGYVPNNTDCDDSDPNNFPGNTEVCDGFDNNCDGIVDEGVLLTFYADSDGDGFGNAADSVERCSAPQDYVNNDEDCDDNDANNYPGNTEICDGADNNCDGFVDEGVLTTFYVDNDSDGFGHPSDSIDACDQPPGYIDNNTDCDDNDPNNFPGNTEVCDGFDNNCNGLIDESGSLVFYADSDGDTYGDSNNTIMGCFAPAGYVADNTDCDDTDPNIFPGNPEVCDGKDNNCDGNVDENVTNTYYADSDNDGYGDASIVKMDCSAPVGYVADNTDCDDADSNNFPGNTEICDGKDNNCDGNVDENVMNTYYIDADNDGYGDPTSSTMACAQPPGYASNNTDCDDNNSNNHPNNNEDCDGQDNNCDGIVDEGCGPPPQCEDAPYLVINTITQNAYHAEININSNALLNNGQSILFTAGSSIDLVGPFEVTLGTVFEARIQPCIPTSANGGNSGNYNSPFENIEYSILTKIGYDSQLDILIKDVQGNIITEETIASYSEDYLENNLGNLPVGMYELSISNGTEVINEKIMIVK